MFSQDLPRSRACAQLVLVSTVKLRIAGVTRTPKKMRALLLMYFSTDIICTSSAVVQLRVVERAPFAKIDSVCSMVMEGIW